MQRENGIVIGVVVDLDDPEQLGRVRVKFPHLNDEVSDWSRLATPLGGKDRGWFLRPEKDDEVLVACEQGDPRRTYVVGSLWKKIEISCSSGDVAISAPSGKLSLDANQIEIKAKASMSIEASGALTIKGSTVAIN